MAISQFYRVRLSGLGKNYFDAFFCRQTRDCVVHNIASQILEIKNVKIIRFYTEIEKEIEKIMKIRKK